MKIVTYLCSTLLMLMLMCHGIETAPQSSTSLTQKDVNLDEVADENAQPKETMIGIHGNYITGPDYGIHVNDHSGPVHSLPLKDDGILLKTMKYVKDTLNYFKVTDYVQQYIPIKGQYGVAVSAPATYADKLQDKETLSFWDNILYLFIKRNHLARVDKVRDDDEEDEEEKHENEVIGISPEYTTVTFDPMGQLMSTVIGMLNSALKRYPGMKRVYFWLKENSVSMENIYSWWESLKKQQKLQLLDFTPFIEEQIESEDVTGKEDPQNDEIIHPEGILTMDPYNPAVFAVNIALLIGYFTLFWRTYLPLPFDDDYPDYDPADYIDDAAGDDDDDDDGDDDGARKDSNVPSDQLHENSYFYQDNNPSFYNYNQGEPYAYQSGEHPPNAHSSYIKKK